MVMHEERPTINVRVPSLNLTTLNRYWLGDDPIATQMFNALSFLFPQGERYFIRSVKAVCENYEVKNHKLKQDIRKFTAQEKIHTTEHETYNALLESLGYTNYAYMQMEKLETYATRTFSPLTNLAIVAAFEHYTALLGEWLLSRPDLMEKADNKMALIWGWHSIEEIEHKSVCFDLYIEAGGSWWTRTWTFFFVSHHLGTMYFKNYWGAHRDDKLLQGKKRFNTIVQTVRFFYGKKGVMRHLLRHAFTYIRPSFKPWQNDNRTELKEWIHKNEKLLYLSTLSSTQ